MSVFGNGQAIIMMDDSETDLHLAERCYRRSKLENPWLGFCEQEELFDYLEAVKEGREAMPALVLLDINMPDLNGFEMIERIRKDAFFAELPMFLMFTHSDRSSDRERASAAGASGYWVKPADLEEYVELFDRLVQAA